MPSLQESSSTPTGTQAWLSHLHLVGLRYPCSTSTCPDPQQLLAQLPLKSRKIHSAPSHLQQRGCRQAAQRQTSAKPPVLLPCNGHFTGGCPLGACPHSNSRPTAEDHWCHGALPLHLQGHCSARGTTPSHPRTPPQVSPRPICSMCPPPKVRAPKHCSVSPRWDQPPPRSPSTMHCAQDRWLSGLAPPGMPPGH